MQVSQDNLASRRVMEKAGLTLVRTYHIPLADLSTPSGTHRSTDDVEYALLKTDWEQQEAAGCERLADEH